MNEFKYNLYLNISLYYIPNSLKYTPYLILHNRLFLIN